MKEQKMNDTEIRTWQDMMEHIKSAHVETMGDDQGYSDVMNAANDVNDVFTMAEFIEQYETDTRCSVCAFARHAIQGTSNWEG